MGISTLAKVNPSKISIFAASVSLPPSNSRTDGAPLAGGGKQSITKLTNWMNGEEMFMSYFVYKLEVYSFENHNKHCSTA